MRIRTLITTTALAAGVIAASALPASAGVCYDISATINGETTAAADCIDA